MADEQAGRGFRLPWQARTATRVRRTDPAPIPDWRDHAALTAGGRRGPLCAVDRRDRSAAPLSAGHPARRDGGASRSASARTRSSRPDAAGTSSTAMATCSPIPSTPIRSSPTRPRLRTSTRWRRACVPRSIAAMRRSGWRSPRACAGRDSSRGSSARCRPTRSGGCGRSSSRASASSRRAVASIRSGSCWPTCSATSASMTSAWPASSRRPTRSSAVPRARSSSSSTPSAGS